MHTIHRISQPQTYLSVIRYLSISFLCLWFMANAIFAQENELLDPGSTDGQFEVSLAGGATYSIPIDCPPGTAGMKPEISLFYSGGNESSPAGAGWSVQGIPVITRGYKNLERDGIVAGPKFSDNDAFFLDGMRLLPIARDSSGAWIEYRKEVDDQTRIRGYGNNQDGHDFYRTWTKAGLILEFGKTTSSHVCLKDGRTLLWTCNRISDTLSNYITIEYLTNETGNYNISKISYTGNSKGGLTPYAFILFEYETLPNPLISYISGNQVIKNVSLKSIKTLFGDQLMRDYCLTYTKTDAPSQFLLSSIQEFGHDGRGFPPTRFEYSKPKPGWKRVADFTPRNLPGSSGKAVARYGSRYLDINNDERADYIFSALVNGKFEKRSYLSQPAGWEEDINFTPPIIFATDAGPTSGFLITDINGDNRPDIVVSRGNKQTEEDNAFYLNSSEGWKQAGPEWHLPFQLATTEGITEPYLFLDFNGDGKLDAIFEKDGQPNAIFSTDQGWEEYDDFIPPFFLSKVNKAFRIDVDGNKRDDVVLIEGTGENSKWRVFLSMHDGWKEAEEDSGFRIGEPVPPTSKAIQIADINSDGLDDIVISFDSENRHVRTVLLSSKNGWILSERVFPIAFVRGSTVIPIHFADLNGDGRLDLFTRTEQQNSGVAFINNKDQWVFNEDLVPTQPLHIKNEDELTAFVTDIDGNGKSDIVYQVSAIEHGITRASYLSTGDSWKLAIKYAPPHRVAEDGKRDSGVKFVDVNADGLSDLIYHLKRKNGSEKGVYFNGPQGWDETPNDKWAPPVPLAEEGLGGVGTRFIDINGDGKADLLKAWKSKSGTLDLKTFINSDNGWVLTPDFNPIFPFAKEKFGSLGARLLDLNGDGLTDLIYAFKEKSGNISSYAYLNTGQGWQAAPNFKPPVPLTESFVYLPPDQLPLTVPEHIYKKVLKLYQSRGLGVLITDINGDRLPDIVFNHEYKDLKAEHINVFPIPGPFPIPRPLPIPGPSIKFKKWKLSRKVTAVKGAFINTGSGWKRDDSYAPPRKLDGNDNAKTAYYESQDVNRDGLVDLIYIEKGKGNGANNSITYLNTGAGWEKTNTWKVPNDAFGDIEGDQGIRIMDLNGDNYIDLLYSRKNKNGKILKKTFLNNGHDWKEENSYAPPYALAESSDNDTGVRIVDVNGDFLADFIVSRKKADGSSVEEVHLNTAGRRDLISSITNGLGFKIGVSHRVLTNYRGPDGFPLLLDFYQPDNLSLSKYPFIAAPPPAIGVDKVYLEEYGGISQSFRYRYGGFRVNSLSGEPLGFRWREIINQENSVIEHSELSQERFKVGRLIHHYTGFSDGSTQGVDFPLSYTENNWKITTTNSLLTKPDNKPIEIIQAHLQSGKTISYDLDGTELSWQSEKYDFDAFGNAKKTEIKRSDGSYTDTENYYDNNIDQWHLGRLRESKAIIGNGEAERQERKAEFKYDSVTGLLIEEISNATHAKALTVKYQYDVFGNTINTKSSAQGVQDRTTKTIYDQQGRFVVANENALGHRSTGKMEPLFGNPITATEPNGATISYSHDSHGRSKTSKSSTGVITRTQYLFVDKNRNSNAIYLIRTTTGGLPPSEAYFDCKHRLIKNITQGYKGRKVFTQTKYDSLGREIGNTVPYFEGDTPLWALITYDDIDRPVTITSPDGSVVHYSYNGYTTYVKDKKGRTTETEYNLRKLPIRVTDPTKGTIRYYYDVGDRISRIVNADDNVILHEYDELGNRVKTSDPDLGTWCYEYSAYGQLIWQKDAKGVETTIEYDILGRPLLRETNNQKAQWGYDTSENGIGYKAFTLGSDGYKEEYEYDKFGRPRESRFYIKGYEYCFRTSFDRYGRTNGIEYPTGFTITQRYDHQGFVSEVLDSKTGHSYWKAIRYNEYGQVEEETLGNGITTVKEYSRLTGRLKGIKSSGLTNRAGVNIQNYTYRYDLAGNLTSRSDQVIGTEETFEYDSLDRLTHVKSSGNLTHHYRYDQTGNIISKSDIGTYEYGKAGPAHGVTSVTGVDGSVKEYKYDANGNMTHSPSSMFFYNSSNQVTHINSNWAKWSSFQYSPDGARYFQDWRKGLQSIQTIYLGLYEKIQEEMVRPFFSTNERLRHRYYIPTPSGLSAVVEDVTEFFPVRYSPSSKIISSWDEKRERSSNQFRLERFLHHNLLGSVTEITDELGSLVIRNRYDVWGKRLDKKPGTYHEYKLGFTGHEHLDHLELIHMNGRVFDPNIARFISADPFIQDPATIGSYNRYAYTLNNPLKFVDPSGFGWFKRTLKKVGRAISKPFKELGSLYYNNILKPAWKFLKKNKDTVMIVAAVVATVVTAGAASPALMVMYGMATGAVLGGMNAALNGGELSDIAFGALRGAAIGGVSAGAFAAVGQVASGVVQQGIGHGLVSGFMNELQGGDFKTGFATGMFMSFWKSGISQVRGFSAAGVARTSLAALAGGTVSQVGGGKFVNGAITAAAGEMVRSRPSEGRPLTNEEIEAARKVFGKTIDYSRVRVIADRFLPFQGENIVMAPEGNIYWPGASSNLANNETFIHEMAHVQQYQQGMNVLARGMPLQLSHALELYDPYDYTYIPGKPYGNYNIEQQGDIAVDIFRGNIPNIIK